MKFLPKILWVLMGMLFAFTLAPTHAQPVPEIDQPLAQINTGHKIYKLDWHPDGGILAAASADGLTHSSARTYG